jgi:hypothetical protein
MGFQPMQAFFAFQITHQSRNPSSPLAASGDCQTASNAQTNGRAMRFKRGYLSGERKSKMKIVQHGLEAHVTDA